MRSVLAVAAVLLAGCGSAGGGGPRTPRQTFAGTCGTCHTLRAAGTSGTFGPNLDGIKPSKALVLATIKKGPGAMPAGLLRGKDADAVATYVSGAAGKVITAADYGARGRRRAEKLGIPLERLPPGQSPTLKFPLLQILATAEMDDALWTLRVSGAVEHPFELDLAGLREEPAVDLTTDIHCVTRWSKFDTTWRGVRVRDLLDRAAPLRSATHVMVHGHDGYTTNLPLAALFDDDVLIAHTYDGAPLSREHGGPARLLVPQLYFWKSAKWVSALELLDRDEPGVWERNGYHNDADPWAEQRRAAASSTRAG